MGLTSARHVELQELGKARRLLTQVTKMKKATDAYARAIAKEAQQNEPPEGASDEADDSRIYVPGRGWLDRGSDEFYECLSKWLDDEITMADVEQFTGSKSLRRSRGRTGSIAKSASRQPSTVNDLEPRLREMYASWLCTCAPAGFGTPEWTA